MSDNVFTGVVISFHPQRGEEWTWARTACAQEGDHPQPALCRRHRSGRSGQHALPGLLQRQKQTAERPALRWVSDWRGRLKKTDRGVFWRMVKRQERKNTGTRGINAVTNRSIKAARGFGCMAVLQWKGWASDVRVQSWPWFFSSSYEILQGCHFRCQSP